MRNRRRDVMVVIGTAALVTGSFQAGPPTTGQAPDFSAARLEGHRTRISTASGKLSTRRIGISKIMSRVPVWQP